MEELEPLEPQGCESQLSAPPESELFVRPELMAQVPVQIPEPNPEASPCSVSPEAAAAGPALPELPAKKSEPTVY